jgi:hypothetical protein
MQGFSATTSNYSNILGDYYIVVILVFYCTIKAASPMSTFPQARLPLSVLPPVVIPMWLIMQAITMGSELLDFIF